MTNYVYANFINTTLANALTSSDTSLTVASTAHLPTLAAGETLALTLNDNATHQVFEIVYATAISGSTITVTRGQEGTAAVSWSVGDSVGGAATAAELASFSGQLAGQIPAQATALNSSTNLNTLTAPALYYQAVTANAALALNYPVVASGALEVKRNGVLGTTGITQMYYGYNNNGVFYRTSNNGSSWTTWALFASVAQLNTSIATRALLAGSASQAFSVANAATASQAVALGQFTSSISTNGYRTVPDANSPTKQRIFQYGYISAPYQQAYAVVFPITFPTAIISSTIQLCEMFADGSGNADWNPVVYGSITNSGMNVFQNWNTSVGPAPLGINWQVWGY